jgi:hypothetical protein
VGGALALDAAWLFAAFLIILVLIAAGIAARRFLLERGGGTVECGLRRGNGTWRLGVASYRREELCWFGVFGFSVRPVEVFPRRNLSVVSRRLPSTDEAGTLGPGMIVIECAVGGDESLPETGGDLGKTSAGSGLSDAASAATASAATASAASAATAGPSAAAGPATGHAGALQAAGSAGADASAGLPVSAGSPSADEPSGIAGSSDRAGSPDSGETASTPAQPSIVELAMGEAALTGFLSWLEAAPPSSHLGIAFLKSRSADRAELPAIQGLTPHDNAPLATGARPVSRVRHLASTARRRGRRSPPGPG